MSYSNKENISKKIDDYNVKCYMLGVKPCTIEVGYGGIKIVGANRSIKHCIIPSFVNKIGRESFQNCKLIEKNTYTG